MAHGGARSNAGRKPGSLSRFNREMVERASSGGDLPLDYMLEVMRDESLSIRLRIDAAKAAAPYVHQRLSAIAVDLTTSEVGCRAWPDIPLIRMSPYELLANRLCKKS